MNKQQILSNPAGKVIIGIDEVGRGSWAGPLVVGAVILDQEIVGIADSKTIDKKRRREIAQTIRQRCVAASTGWVSPAEVDELGLTKATTLAINRAIEDIKIYDCIIIDGSINFLKENLKAFNVIKADALVPAVSAASIVAKVARDEYMAEQALIYPDYGFDSHVGYGTARHKKALIDYGITSLHRKSYKPVKAFVGLG